MKRCVVGDSDIATDRDEQCEGQSLCARVGKDQTAIDVCDIAEDNVGDG